MKSMIKMGLIALAMSVISSSVLVFCGNEPGTSTLVSQSSSQNSEETEINHTLQEIENDFNYWSNLSKKCALLLPFQVAGSSLLLLAFDPSSSYLKELLKIGGIISAVSLVAGYFTYQCATTKAFKALKKYLTILSQNSPAVAERITNLSWPILRED